jgi:hypothetical protein
MSAHWHLAAVGKGGMQMLMDIGGKKSVSRVHDVAVAINSCV